MRKPPGTIEPQIHPSFESLSRVEAPAHTLVRVEGARLVGSNGLVVLPDGSFVGEMIALTVPGRRVMLEQQAAYREPLPRKATHKDGHYYPLFSIGWENYYHWTHDVVMSASRITDRLPADTTFVIPPSLKSFQLEPLELLGIDPARLETFDGKSVWQFESLFFPTPIFKTQIDVREPLEWFRAAALARYRIPPPVQRRRLYVSRRLDYHHRTVNEPEVVACLRGFGFESVLPGTMSFRDQVALFSEAEVIVGTGSGLNSNMIFAPKGAHILQWQDPTHIVNAVWTMAEALGHRYSYFMAEAVPNGDLHANLFVPLDRLEEALDAMLSETVRRPRR